MTDDLVARFEHGHGRMHRDEAGYFVRYRDYETERAARVKAEEERDETSKSLENLLDPQVRSMRLENGKLDVTLCGEVVQRLALIVTGWFRESGAKNYFEMTLNARDEPFERYTFTIQKRGDGAQSPHELRIAAEARVRELEAVNAALNERAAQYERLYRDATAETIERCARVAVSHISELGLSDNPAYVRFEPADMMARKIATAIRKLAQEVKHEAE